MRTVNATIQAGLDASVTVPVYLVECRMSPSTLYWSTGGALTWNSQSWQTAGLEVIRVNERGGSIRIRNDDNSGASLALNAGFRDIEFRVYQYYNGDAVEVFRGYGGKTTVSAMFVTIELHADRGANTKVPRTRIAPPTFTYLPKKGEVIQWGEITLKVEY